MREQKKNDEKGYFFRDGRCHNLGKEKCYFCRKRVCFYKLYKRLQKQEGMRFNLLHWKGYFLTGHNGKGYTF